MKTKDRTGQDKTIKNIFKKIPKQKKRQGIAFVLVIALYAVLLASCAGEVSAVPFLRSAVDSTAGLSLGEEEAYFSQSIGQLAEFHIEEAYPEADYFSSSLCVPTEEDFAAAKEGEGWSDSSTFLYDTNGWIHHSAFLFNITTNQVLYADNCYTPLYPASTTKLLTALVALKYGNMSDIVTFREDNGGITVNGAKLCGFRKGDRLTLEALLNSMMIYSGNDAAVAIAEHISGSVEAFVDLMNREAAAIGATDTHFVNPHGLHDSQHATTAYDLYLIFLECLKYDEFLRVISQTSYTANYIPAENYIPANNSGESAEDGTSNDGVKTEYQRVFENTNWYSTGECEPPEGVTVYGGKTGSTNSAGYCLIILSSYQGEYYLSAVFRAPSWDSLYQQMNALLELETHFFK